MGASPIFKQHKHCSLNVVPQTHSIWQNKQLPRTSHSAFLLSAGKQWYGLNMCLVNICLWWSCFVYLHSHVNFMFYFWQRKPAVTFMFNAFILKLLFHLLPICFFFVCLFACLRTLKHIKKTYLHHVTFTLLLHVSEAKKVICSKVFDQWGCSPSLEQLGKAKKTELRRHGDPMWKFASLGREKPGQCKVTNCWICLKAGSC